MILWTVVPLAQIEPAVVPPGADVPARVVMMEQYRRDRAATWFTVGVEADAIDWTGLDEAAAALSRADVFPPVRRPR